MASKPVIERLCEQCGKDNKQRKARTVCLECQTLLCVSCSNYHIRLRSTKDHHLIELDPLISKQTSTSFNVDQLTSDFLETVTLTEDTVLYRGAEVAVESTSVTTKLEKRTTSKQTEPKQLKASKCLEFSVKRSEDMRRVYVSGVLCVSDNVVVVDNENKVLKLYDQSGTYLSSTKLKNDTWGITCVRDSTFATCGLGQTVHLWTVGGQTIVSEDVSYHVDHRADGMHYNGTYYCIVRVNDAITILDRHGRQVRKIIMKEACGKTFRFGLDIHMDSDTNNIYVPCWQENGVLCMTIEGNALWFTTLSGTWGITEIRGTLCVADYNNTCLHLITKGGEYVRKLMDKKDLGGKKPRNICYGQNGKLYVSYDYSDIKHGIISVFSVS